jgi:hypothetical protein
LTVVADTQPTPRVEPTMALEWAQAVEQTAVDSARTPADGRRGWLHQAPEKEVLARYLDAIGIDPALPAPWWLRALAAGKIDSRAKAYSLEDGVARVLDSRPGWVFVPWGADGDTGFWEYMPSERTLSEPGEPTTLVLTDRHDGLIDIYPVHAGEVHRLPIAVDGLADLGANLARIEALS